MQLSIYNRYNKLVNIDLPDKPIRSIFVLVFSDNETGKVEFEDGATLSFSADGSDPRVPGRYDYYGDCYTVSSDMITQWMAYRPCVRAWAASASCSDTSSVLPSAKVILFHLPFLFFE